MSVVSEEASYLEQDSIADTYEQTDILWTKFDKESDIQNQTTDHERTDMLIDK